MVPYINNTPIGPDADATVEQKSKVYDVRSLRHYSVEATLSGTGSGVSNLVVTAYASNQVPPNGGAPNRGWQPDASSWYPLGTATLTADGTVVVSGEVNASWFYVDCSAGGATDGKLVVNTKIEAQAT